MGWERARGWVVGCGGFRRVDWGGRGCDKVGVVLRSVDCVLRDCGVVGGVFRGLNWVVCGCDIVGVVLDGGIFGGVYWTVLDGLMIWDIREGVVGCANRFALLNAPALVVSV